jgi:hypothetical protein
MNWKWECPERAEKREDVVLVLGLMLIGLTSFFGILTGLLTMRLLTARMMLLVPILLI